MGFVETIGGLVDRLRAAGMEAASDARDLNPPAALVTVAALLPATKMCGTGRVRAFVELVARDSGDTAALAQLQAMHRATEAVLGGEIVADAEAPFTRRLTAADPTGLPALRLMVETPTLPDTPDRNGSPS